MSQCNGKVGTPTGTEFSTVTVPWSLRLAPMASIQASAPMGGRLGHKNRQTVW